MTLVSLDRVCDVLMYRKFNGVCRFSPRRNLTDPIEFPIHSITQGICFGECIDFISNFLKAFKKNGLWIENIAPISTKYREKGTPVAQITQILYSAQNLEALPEHKIQEMEKSELLQQSEVLKQKRIVLEEKLGKLDILGEEQRKILLQENAQLRKDQEVLLFQLAQIGLGKIDSLDVGLKRVKPLAQWFGLDIGQSQRISVEEITKDTFSEYLARCLPGPILIGLHGLVGSHAIAYLKQSDQQGYLFDPNTATFLLSNTKDQAKTIREMIDRVSQQLGVRAIDMYHFSTDGF